MSALTIPVHGTATFDHEFSNSRQRVFAALMNEFGGGVGDNEPIMYFAEKVLARMRHMVNSTTMLYGKQHSVYRSNRAWCCLDQLMQKNYPRRDRADTCTNIQHIRWTTAFRHAFRCVTREVRVRHHLYKLMDQVQTAALQTIYNKKINRRKAGIKKRRQNRRRDVVALNLTKPKTSPDTIIGRHRRVPYMTHCDSASASSASSPSPPRHHHRHRSIRSRRAEHTKYTKYTKSKMALQHLLANTLAPNHPITYFGGASKREFPTMYYPQPGESE